MRTERYNKEIAIAFGHDHAVGYFLQIWELNPEFSIKSIENLPDYDNIIYDKDEMFDGITIDEIILKAREYNFNLTKEEFK